MSGTRTLPRAVVCVVEGRHRDLDLARAVCGGRFRHCGIEVELGTEPDWLGAELPHDDEWQIEWWKFGYALDLAHAFEQTGDRSYAACFERLVLSFAAHVPVDARSSDVAARRLLHWVYAWTRLADAVEADLAPHIAELVAFVRANLTAERNHRTFELYSLLVAALALPELDGAGELQAYALEELGANLQIDVLPDGVQRERSTHYHLIALQSFLGAAANADLFDLELPDGFTDRLDAACTFALHCHRPDGEIPALSDADGGGYLADLELAAGLLGRADLRWVATGGRAGSPPAARSAWFEHGGYAIQRSGFGEHEPLADERFLLLDCGPVGDGGHGHYDALSVEAYGLGRPLVVDPGRYTYAEGDPNLRHWFKGTAAHNTVVVDRLDQTPYRRGKPLKGTAATTRLVSRHRLPGREVLVGEVRSTQYDTIHRRTVTFVADACWLIEDELDGTIERDFDLRWHLAPGAAPRVGRRGPIVVVEAVGLLLEIEGAADVRIERGWVSRIYGERDAAPVVSARARGRHHRFTTLLEPVR
jgi:Heparinase II/III-like protein/Heparinase II/III N-terminus